MYWLLSSWINCVVLILIACSTQCKVSTNLSRPFHKKSSNKKLLCLSISQTNAIFLFFFSVYFEMLHPILQEQRRGRNLAVFFIEFLWVVVTIQFCLIDIERWFLSGWKIQQTNMSTYSLNSGCWNFMTKNHNNRHITCCIWWALRVVKRMHSMVVGHQYFDFHLDFHHFKLIPSCSQKCSVILAELIKLLLIIIIHITEINHTIKMVLCK